MSIAALPQASCTTHFRYKKGFCKKIQWGVMEQRACIKFLLASVSS